MSDLAGRVALALPFRRFTIVTPLTDEEVRRRVRTLFVRGAFEGMLTREGFTCTRVITHENSFLPQIEARLDGDDAATMITVTMRLSGLVQGFMVVWMAFVFLAAMTALDRFRSGADDNLTAMLVPFGMLVFGYALTTGAFVTEARKARTLLERALVE